MFSIKENECVGFESIWKVKKVSIESSSQTTNYASKEIETNTAVTVDSEAQTESYEPARTSNVDMEKLSEWLTRIFPKVSRELNESVNSHAFKNYRPSNDSVQPVTKLIQSLNVHNNLEGGDVAYRVAALSFNSTGNTLAVSCNHSHKSWCRHVGVISLFTFDRNDVLPDVPHKKLSATACVTVVRFHPSLPSVIAAGTHSGEILVWNIQYDEGDNLICKLNGHDEAVTHMAWVFDADGKTPLIASSSLDGCLILWNFSLSASKITVKHKYKIKAPILSKLKGGNVPEEIAKKVIRGIITFDFSKYMAEMFVVGIEGGLVVQCSTLGTATLKGSTNEVPISDPVYKYFEPHGGEVTTVSFSPNRKDMFFSSGTDGEIRIYIIGQDEPAQVIFLEKPLLGLSWVPFHEQILSGCGPKGMIEIFKVVSGKSVDVVINEKVDITTLTQMELNRARVTTVAVGNNKGILQIWSVPWNLYNYQD